MFKKLSFVFLLLLSSFLFISCKNNNIIDESLIYGTRTPDLSIPTGDYELDFVDMNNYVIEYLNSEFMPFFFVKSNKDGLLSGDNEKKLITITCVCTKGTTVNDVDLFLSMLLNGIGFNSAEQDYRFKNPTVGPDGSYTDFGTVFNIYDLKIDAKDEDGKVLHDDYIKATERIPIDPRYIKE